MIKDTTKLLINQVPLRTPASEPAWPPNILHCFILLKTPRIPGPPLLEIVLILGMRSLTSHFERRPQHPDLNIKAGATDHWDMGMQTNRCVHSDIFGLSFHAPKEPFFFSSVFSLLVEKYRRLMPGV